MTPHDFTHAPCQLRHIPEPVTQVEDMPRLKLQRYDSVTGETEPPIDVTQAVLDAFACLQSLGIPIAGVFALGCLTRLICLAADVPELKCQDILQAGYDAFSSIGYEGQGNES